MIDGGNFAFGLSDSVGPYGQSIQALVAQIRETAGNVGYGTNPPFEVSDFLNIFPQFGPEINENYQEIISMFIEMANSCIIQNRWQSKWKYGMALFTGHFYTLYLETQAGMNKTLGQVVANAGAQFPKSSKSVGDVSVGYDVGSITGDLPGWGFWKATTFGIQLASIAKIIGKSGMYVW